MKGQVYAIGAKGDTFHPQSKSLLGAGLIGQLDLTAGANNALPCVSAIVLISPTQPSFPLSFPAMACI